MTPTDRFERFDGFGEDEYCDVHRCEKCAAWWDHDEIEVWFTGPDGRTPNTRPMRLCQAHKDYSERQITLWKRMMGV